MKTRQSPGFFVPMYYIGRMKGKIAIVTGAGQGIGFEICRLLAAEGAIIFLNDLLPELAEQAAGVINQAFPGSCLAAAGDSSDISFIQGMVSKATSLHGRIDIVIANAGITLFGDFLSYYHEDFMKVMQVNLSGSFFLAQAAALQMKNQYNGGAILFTSSVTGHQALKSLAAYSMSKAALEMLAKNLVVELSPFKINVNAIAPGATLTERTREEADYEKVWSGITPMGRAATTTDIAHAAVFLVSEKARHITGQTLIIDGGWTSVSRLPDGIK